jgi:hypothetical protein
MLVNTLVFNVDNQNVMHTQKYKGTCIRRCAIYTLGNGFNALSLC